MATRTRTASTPTPPVRIGTAGWSLPAASRDRFDPASHQLLRYASRLDAVEINSSFYRSHSRDTYAKWAALVPADFRFSVKLPRTITQYARLRDCAALVDAFLAEVDGLGDRLGRLLVQLPPSLVFDENVADAFFASLAQRTQATLACEPRHPSWAQPDADAVLQAHGVARVAADPARFGADAEPAGAAPAYWRLHGSPRIYYDAYDEARLQALAAGLRASPGAWVIFDNTAHGHATANALRLRELLGAPTTGG